MSSPLDDAARADRLAALPVLDWSYGKTPTYDVPGGCLTCGQRFIVRREKGVKPPLSVECPSCECIESGWRALAQPAPDAPCERHYPVMSRGRVRDPWTCVNCGGIEAQPAAATLAQREDRRRRTRRDGE